VELLEACISAGLTATELLFSESNTRFLIEVDATRETELLECLRGVAFVKLGAVADHALVKVSEGQNALINVPWQELFDAWHAPLDWA
jgi:phosphoribosylformylglycinamidine synthase